MSRLRQRVPAAGYATATLGAVAVPTLLMTHTAHRGSVPPSWPEFALIAASGTVGAGYGLATYRRLARTDPPARRRTDRWIAALHALVALALLTPALLGLVLYHLGPLQPWLGHRPVLLCAIWAAVHLAAASAAEVTGRAVTRWLRGDPERSP